MCTVLASVPGKLILMGEHAAVYGRPALVAAVGLRSRVRIAGGGEPGVEIELPDLPHRERSDWPSLIGYAGGVRQAWESYRERPSRETFARVRGADPAHLVKVALGETATALGVVDPPPLALRVESELPVASGFGSSAAIAVGVVAAFVAVIGRPLGLEQIDRLALDIERRLHGLPSGVDTATVLRGGVLSIRAAETGGLEVEPLRPVAELLEQIEVVHTGVPREATGEVVAAVRQRAERDRSRFEGLLDRMEELVRGLRAALVGSVGEPVSQLIQEYEGCLEELGVVPAPIRELIRRIETAGGTAKISGAGALSGAAAGSLLVFRSAAAAAAVAEVLAGHRRLPMEIGADGLRLEVYE